MVTIRQIATTAAFVIIASTAGSLAASPASASGDDCPWNSPTPCLASGAAPVSTASIDDCPWNSPTPCLLAVEHQGTDHTRLTGPDN
jgi:hypothetical protein